MDKKPKPSRENIHALLSTKSKSNLNSSRLTATQKNEKAGKPKPYAVETQPLRNFRLSTNLTQTVKKTYQKNSDKTIKPPERQKSGNNADGRSIASSLAEDKVALLRGNNQVSNHAIYLAGGERSITDNFEPNLLASIKRVDTKTIDELEKRLENLQSILLRKIEILKNRFPEKLKKEYKFIALVVGDESKLVIKENDAKCFPGYLPAKSIEDLNRKAGEFYIACLLSFVDKLRFYEEEGRPINCNEIYDELKKDEKGHCNILQDWISEFCDDTDKTLVEREVEAPKIPSSHQEVQTEVIEEQPSKSFSDQDMQTDIIELDKNDTEKHKELIAKMDKLRLKHYELKDQLAEQKENYMYEIELLKKKQKEKITDLMDSWQKEICEKNNKEADISKERQLNEDLSQQVIDLRERLNELMEQYEKLSNKQQQEEDAHTELKKLRIELEQAQKENLELQDLKSHFLKKLDQRYARNELLDKEIKIQKRTIQAKTEEIEQLKKQFDAKAKENRQNKESLEARNKLIDHLRNAVEIDQKKIREYELMLESKSLPTEIPEEEQETERDAKLKRVKSKSVHTGRSKNAKKGKEFPATEISKVPANQPPLLDDLSVQNNFDGPKPQKNRAERSKKKNFTFSEDISFDAKAFQEAISADTSSEVEKSPVRNVKPRKRTRDIVVKKYSI